MYYAATALHPGIQMSFLTKAYGNNEEWLLAARQLVHKLWEEEYRDLPVRTQNGSWVDLNLQVFTLPGDKLSFDHFIHKHGHKTWRIAKLH